MCTKVDGKLVIYWDFLEEGNCPTLLHTASIFRVMMEAVSTSEMSVYFSETTQCYIQESFIVKKIVCFLTYLFIETHLSGTGIMPLIDKLHSLRTNDGMVSMYSAAVLFILYSRNIYV
jgi:hypothetical protein